jgi:hypothetical protein
MGKVLDINERIKTQKQAKPGPSRSRKERPSPMVDITEMRASALRDDRRNVKRTILTEFIAVHAVVPQMGLVKVSLFDITRQGLSFDLEDRSGAFKAGEEVAMRVYLNHQTYFPFVAVVKHTTHIEDEGLTRHGVEFVTGTINDIALQHFVAFIETVSASLRYDKGDVLVSNINS